MRYVPGLHWHLLVLCAQSSAGTAGLEGTGGKKPLHEFSRVTAKWHHDFTLSRLATLTPEEHGVHHLVIPGNLPSGK